VNCILIPARGGSKGIKNKNLLPHPITGYPLVWHAVNTALATENDFKVFVSSDSEDILNAATMAGAIPLLRPLELSGDEVSTEKVLLHILCSEVGFHNTDNITLMQCTSPFTEAQDIDNMLEQWQNSGRKSAVSVTPGRGGFLCGGFDWTDAGPCYDIQKRPRRQEMSDVYRENGALYMIKAFDLLNNQCRITKDAFLYKMPQERSFEIDSQEELKILKRWDGA